MRANHTKKSWSSKFLYLEQQEMLELMKKNYWWPEIKGDVKKYVYGYTKYQQNKVQHMKKMGELHLLEISKRLWQEISINIIKWERHYCGYSRSIHKDNPT